MSHEIWEYYQNEKPEIFAGSTARLSFIVKSMGKTKKILNIGVGGGNFEGICRKLNMDVYSVDPSEKTILNLRDKFNMAEQAKVGFSNSLPFQNQSFDCVVASELFEHLSREVLRQTVLEIFRVLKPEGICIGTVPFNEQLERNQVICPACKQQFHRWGHLHSFTLAKIRVLLEKQFKIQKLSRRLFVDWVTLNWKGKGLAGLKLLLHFLGFRISGESIFFLAIKSKSV